MLKGVVAGAFGVLLMSQPVVAQQKMSRAEISKECSRQADEKSLHGKARKTFRNRCKRDMGRSKVGKSGKVQTSGREGSG